MGPLDWNGPAFLSLYLTLLVAALILSLALPAQLRPRGRPATGTVDAETLALLAGGPTRFAESVTARLLSRGALQLRSMGRFLVLAPETAAGTAAERAVLRLPSPTSWKQLFRVLHAEADGLQSRLQQAGLLADAAERQRMRFWRAAPFLAVGGFGAVKLCIGIGRDRPVGFLTALLVVTAVLALMRWFGGDRRTAAGVDALREARKRHSRLARAPTADELGLGVALFGTVVLAGSGWADFHRLRTPNTDSSSGDGSGSSGCGSGGGGGGGCGGCSS